MNYLLFNAPQNIDIGMGWIIEKWNSKKTTWRKENAYDKRVLRNKKMLRSYNTFGGNEK